MRRGKSITLTDGIRNILTEFCKSRSCPVFLNKRSEFILLAAEGVSNKAIAAATGAHFNTVQLWRNRFASEQDRLALIEKQCPSDLKDALTEVLSDEKRSGAPLTFKMEVRLKICLIACQNPKDYGFEASHWSLSLLRMALLQENIVEEISIGAIHHILTVADIKPWKIRYYLHSREKYESYETYSEKIRRINSLYAEADSLWNRIPLFIARTR